MSAINSGHPGETILLSGNEALARGALEAGVGFVTSYPGSPTAEVLQSLSEVADQFNLVTQWSVNEKVAMEAAAAAACAGIRSLTIMKCDGLNVAMDFLTSLSPTGVKAGMVIMVGDDPGAYSSAKEEDSRFLARVAHVPVLEPASVAEAPAVMRQAFALSESLCQPVMLRTVTRICHASADVLLDKIAVKRSPAYWPPEQRYITWIEQHSRQERLLELAGAQAEENPYNVYSGPERPKILIVAAGPSFTYALEAVQELGLKGQVGILKLVTIWPLPRKLLLERMAAAEIVLFAEEIEPFLEEQLEALAAREWNTVRPLQFFGRLSPQWVTATGRENDIDVLKKALRYLLGITDVTPAQKEDAGMLPSRELAFCPGCPHRASFWALKAAVELDGRQAIVLGDIGCYTLAKGSTGFSMLNSMHCMGAGAGLANGLGKLSALGFRQPVVAVAGDSTFYHAVVPALINARYHAADFLCIILDNSTTAMTGHQPHPGIAGTAQGSNLPLEEIVSGMGLPLEIADPYNLEEARNSIFSMLQQQGTRVLILRRTCALVAGKQMAARKAHVNQKLCLGDTCGCNRICSRVFACPANGWNEKLGRAEIDSMLCAGCGVCLEICPQGAIELVEREEER